MDMTNEFVDKYWSTPLFDSIIVKYSSDINWKYALECIGVEARVRFSNKETIYLTANNFSDCTKWFTDHQEQLGVSDKTTIPDKLLTLEKSATDYDYIRIVKTWNTDCASPKIAEIPILFRRTEL